MSDAAIHPIQLVLSDVDGTLLHPDHSLSQRTADTVRALRDAGVFFSLASGRPPKAMLHLIETFGIDVPVAGFNGGTLINPDGSILVAHHLPAEAALVTLALFSAEPDVEVWVFADGDWLRRDPPGPMMQREADGLGYGPVVVESFEPYLDRVDKIVAASNNTQLLIELEAQLQPKVQGLAQVSRSQPVYLDVTAMLANKGEALKTLAAHLGVPMQQTAAIGDGGNDPAMFAVAGLSIAMGQAEETVKRQASVVTGSNVEDGAAEAIERFILAPR
ncbi:hydrolase [Pseudomonas sp. Leaf15]|uniref:Cof-type HAD-IIB family hydrolase n=1 Tax=unclassified Pseudomonas TaxID=196821 RepID=UPI0007025F32|nr:MULTISPECIES: Cof-type HAD-IIB family hydrolase [unclassified Pseudomonas]KQM50916.1 hydrolase [Pseudomonas sp. Leaf15]RAH04316.1 Cof-type HAD-IIB family hydrolase [Pseudomonas sp. Leaf98]WLH82324.1 Cof-type HAD-IIB family hydrolase [Pseudomonas sp. FP2338]